jgi:hypothetical protein
MGNDSKNGEEDVDLFIFLTGYRGNTVYVSFTGEDEGYCDHPFHLGSSFDDGILHLIILHPSSNTEREDGNFGYSKIRIEGNVDIEESHEVGNVVIEVRMNENECVSKLKFVEGGGNEERRR